MRYLIFLGVAVFMTVVPSGAEQALTGLADGPGTSVMRYRLRVGEELQYECRSSLKYKKGHWADSRDDKTNYQVWVAGSKSDGSSRLVLNSTYEWWVNYDKGKKKA